MQTRLHLSGTSIPNEVGRPTSRYIAVPRDEHRDLKISRPSEATVYVINSVYVEFGVIFVSVEFITNRTKHTQLKKLLNLELQFQTTL